MHSDNKNLMKNNSNGALSEIVSQFLFNDDRELGLNL